jgi:fructose-1-phosphate kinase PfkB-like protein
MVAGLIYGLLHHAPPKQMLAMAVAAAGATVVREGTQMCTREGFEALLG